MLHPKAENRSSTCRTSLYGLCTVGIEWPAKRCALGFRPVVLESLADVVAGTVGIKMLLSAACGQHGLDACRWQFETQLLLLVVTTDTGRLPLVATLQVAAKMQVASLASVPPIPLAG